MALAQAVGLNVASRSGLAGLERREGIRERAYPGPPPAPPPHPGSAQRVITFGQQGDKIGVVHVNGRPGRIPDGAHETVAFETVLPRELYKRSHSVHNNRSNKAAEADILADPETLAYLDRMIPNALVAVSRKGGRRRPEGWVWHHGLQPGRMELIPEWQHVAKEFQKTLHPERRGGFAMHSIPAGAPRR